jgi:hypothetical protein
LCDGDVIHVPANTTITLEGAPTNPCNTNDNHFCVTNKSFTLEGEDTTSVIVINSPGTGARFLEALDNQHTHSAIVRNLKFVRDDNGSGFMSISGFSAVTVTNVVMDLHSQTFTVGGTDVELDRLDLESHGTLGLVINHAYGNVDYSIHDSKIRMLTGAAGPVLLTLSDAQDGTVAFENNVFSANGGAGEHWLFISGYINHADATNVHLTGNDFKNRIIEGDGSGFDDGTLAVHLSCNNTTLDVCPAALVDISDFDLSVPSPTARYDYGSCPGPIGTIGAQTACVYNAACYVEFSVTNASGVAPSGVWARWADDNCSTGATDVAAWFNSSTGKWNASFDISSVEDNALYWQGKATYCGAVTVTGTCQIRTTRECAEYPDSEPEWYQEP